jgi:hypothetical protein
MPRFNGPTSGNIEDRRVYTGPGQAALRNRLNELRGEKTDPSIYQRAYRFRPEGFEPWRNASVSPEVAAIHTGKAPTKPMPFAGASQMPAKYNPGDIVDGYEFTGGDYKDRANWQDWGDGAKKLPDGSIVRYGPRGGMTVLRQAGAGGAAAGGDPDAPSAPLTPGAEARTRLLMGLGPMADGQRQMYRSEKWAPNERGVRKPTNPLNEQWGAAVIDALDNNIVAKWAGVDLNPVARTIGGQQYQDYDQAMKSYEAAVLPIMSGAAVTPTEAQRLVRADLPQLGDTPATLAKKATNRAMKINAAADLVGKPRPFPKVGTWNPGGSAPAKASSAPVRVQSVDEARKLAPGTVFITPDGRRKVR